LSETKKLLDSLVPLAKKIVEMSRDLSLICKAVESKDEERTRRLVLEITKIEESADSIFESSATQIMNVEFLNVNPDYLLDISRNLDKVSDLLERTALLFQYVAKLEDSEVLELLSAATAQVGEIALEFVACLESLSEDRNEVGRICEVISEREKAVDGIRERFNSHAIQKMGISEYRIWLKDIFGYLDQVADLAREMTIPFRVVSTKLEKQRTLAIKKRV